MKKIKIWIVWMNCKACTINISNVLEKINNVEKAEVSLVNNEAVVYYKNEAPNINEIEEVLLSSWYQIWKNKKSIVSNNFEVYRDAILWFLLLLLWYIFLVKTWIINFSNLVDTTAFAWTFTWWIIIWIIAWVSTCMAAVWWLILSLSAKWWKNSWIKENIKLQSYFHFWRFTSFLIFWWLLWVFWNIVWLSSLWLWLIYLAVWLIMLQIWINLTWIFPRLSSYSLSIPTWIFKKINLKIEKSNLNYLYPFSLWWASFFIPCGFSMAAQIYAISTWSFFQWAMIMLAFAIWTFIPLLWIWSISTFLKWIVWQIIFRVLAVFIVFMWLYNLTAWYNILSSKYDFLSFNNTYYNISDVNINWENLKESLYKVEWMYCYNCVSVIQEWLGKIDWIKNVRADIWTQQVTVVHDLNIISEYEILNLDILQENYETTLIK